MMDGGGMFFGGFMWLLWLLPLVLIVVLIKLILGDGRGGRGRESAEGETPASILKQRYARGEIDRSEYEEKLRDLRD